MFKNFDNLPNDYLGSEYTCLLHEIEEGIIYDDVDGEEIYLGAEIIKIDGKVFKAENLLSYMRFEHPEVFSILDATTKRS